MSNDTILQQAVIDELAGDDDLANSTIAVSVKGGIVHLIGTVATEADLLEAEAAVRNVPGVVRIVDDLRIEPERPLPETAVAHYADRRDAGRALAQQLLEYRHRGDVIVFAASPLGVLVADGIAEVLRAPMDVFSVRRIGAPGYESTSLGRIARYTYLPDFKALECAGMSLNDFMELASAEQERLDRLESFYRDGRPAPPIIGRTIILTDDVLIDESDIPFAVQALHRQAAGAVIVAVPFATTHAAATLTQQTAKVVTLHVIAESGELRAFYRDDADTDAESIRTILTNAARRSDIDV